MNHGRLFGRGIGMKVKVKEPSLVLGVKGGKELRFVEADVRWFDLRFVSFSEPRLCLRQLKHHLGKRMLCEPFLVDERLHLFLKLVVRRHPLETFLVFGAVGWC